MLPVVAKVASLAKSLEILVAAVGRNVVEVRHRQNHFPIGPFRWLPVSLFASVLMVQSAFAHTFATVLGSGTDAAANCLPIVWVARRVVALHFILVSTAAGWGTPTGTPYHPLTCQVGRVDCASGCRSLPQDPEHPHLLFPVRP